MKTMLKLTVVLGLLAVTGCATHSPYNHYSDKYRNTITGAALGAAGGALVGNAMDPHNGVFYGAATGAVLGGGAGYIMDRKRHEEEGYHDYRYDDGYRRGDGYRYPPDDRYSNARTYPYGR